jgi:RimJ/RimL family protein N-acetyltransferase
VERSPLELLRLHVEALFRHDARSRLVETNEWAPRAAPRFYLGSAAGGQVRRFRADLSEAQIDALELLCRDEPVDADPPRSPRRRDALVRALVAPGEVGRVWSGPAYAFPADAPEGRGCIAIGAANADLLRGGFDAWLDDVPHRQPFVASLDSGRVVSVCTSARITALAHEAGVETLSAFRRRGHAANAVAAWATAVRARGALPLYSTSFENVGSQRVAAKLGLSLYGVDFHVS